MQRRSRTPGALEHTRERDAFLPHFRVRRVPRRRVVLRRHRHQHRFPIHELQAHRRQLNRRLVVLAQVDAAVEIGKECI